MKSGDLWGLLIQLYIRCINTDLDMDIFGLSLLSASMGIFQLIMRVLPTVVLFIIWCIANWCLTTLMDGKGKFNHIYMATAYAFTPYVLD